MSAHTDIKQDGGQGAAVQERRTKGVLTTEVALSQVVAGEDLSWAAFWAKSIPRPIRRLPWLKQREPEGRREGEAGV